MNEHYPSVSTPNHQNELPYIRKESLIKKADGSPEEVVISLDNPARVADGGRLDQEAEAIGIDNGSVMAKIESVDETFYLVQPRHQQYSENGMWRVFSEQNNHVKPGTPIDVEFDTARHGSPLALVYVDRSRGEPQLSLRDASNAFAPVTIGRQVSPDKQHARHENRFAGLKNNDGFSREHFSVQRDKVENNVKIEVMSSNVTEVTYATRGQVEYATDAEGSDETIDQVPAGKTRLNERLGAVGLGVAMGEPSIPEKSVQLAEVEQSPKDKLLDKYPILRDFEDRIQQIAAVRNREEAEGYRYGMDQYTTSREMIYDLLDLMAKYKKPALSEDRQGAILRYIDMY